MLSLARSDPVTGQGLLILARPHDEFQILDHLTRKKTFFMAAKTKALTFTPPKHFDAAPRPVCRRNTAHNAGDRISAFKAEKMTRFVGSPRTLPIRQGDLVERSDSGIRKILKPAISGNPSAASGDANVRTAAGTSPPITRSIAAV
jgi:hypothetical protein